MDLYGRPQAPQRSSLNVVFLNERPRPQSFSSHFTAPTGRPDSKTEEEQQQRVNGENFASGVNNNNPKALPNQVAIATSSQLNQHSRPPTIRMNRPQSGGVRRPESSESSALMKQRPQTARDGARTLPPGAHLEDRREMFVKRNVCFQESNPETDDGSSDNREEDEDTPASSWIRSPSFSSLSSAPASLDERYIRQLKDEILYLSQLRHEKSSSSSSSSYKIPQHTVPHNHHIKNMHSIRENKIGSFTGGYPSERPESIQTQLLRYNYSSDLVQVVAAKAKLETILADELTKLMKLFIAVEKEGDEGLAGHELQKNDGESVELKRPPGSADKKLFSYGNGCGVSSPASVFTGAFLGVLHQTEVLKKKMLAGNAEKIGLAETVAKKDKQLVRLSEDIVFFKDALAKDKGSSIGWAQLQSNWRKAVALAKHNREPHDESAALASSSERPDLESEKYDDRAAKISKLEREIGALQVSIQGYQGDKERLSKELAQSKVEREGSQGQLRQTLEQMKALALVHSKELDELRNTMGSQLRSSEKALSVATERYRKLEETATQEKHQLRLDKQELESMLRRKDEELQLRPQQVARDLDKKAGMQLQLVGEQVEKLKAELKRSESKTASLQSQLDTFKADAALLNSTIGRLKTELTQSALHVCEKELSLAKATDSISENECALQQTHSRLEASLDDLEWHKQQLLHQENQLQLLESKLSRSIPVDDEEMQRRKQADESNWNQRLAALEHALASEKQHALSLKAQQQTTLSIERERAEHAVVQFKAVTEELEVANLCLAERKKQREQETQAFGHEKQELQHRIATLDADVSRLRQQQESTKPNDAQETRESLEMEIQRLVDQLRAANQEVESTRLEAQKHAEQLTQQHELVERECEASWQLKMEQEVSKCRAAATLAETVELEVRKALESLGEERDALAQKVQSLERTTPRTSNTALSETRVELQKAKQKLVALEAKLARGDASRAKDLDGKLALLSARDRKSTEEQKSLKKQRNELNAERNELQIAKHAFDQERAVNAAALTKLQDEKHLIKQVVLVLVQRLKLQLSLLAIVPSEVHVATKQGGVKSSSHRDLNGSTLDEFLHQFQHQHVDTWRGMHSKWEQLQQELDDADWQLVHMKNRLEELCLENHQATRAKPGATISTRSHGSGGLNTTSPFSDAVAAGKDTVPVAEQLKASASSWTLACSGAPAPSDVTAKVSLASALAKVEEHETFALALAKEMKAMKDSYEAKIEDLQHELRTAQKLRMESSQRLRAELDDERKRNQHHIAQLTEKCAALEARLAALQRRFTTLQDQEIELLERHADASDETFRRETLHSLFALISDSCRDEMAQRRAQRLERVAKLHAYCGSSSVTVERDDKKQLQ